MQTRIVALNYSAKRSVTNGLKYPASMAMGTESFWICICNSIFYRFTYIVNYLKYLSTNDSMTNMPGRNIWINFEAPQQCIRHINPWKKCSNFMQFLKYLAEPFLRPLMSKDVQCWILRLQPRNFAIISESLAANLEEVRQTSVWQTVPKFWFSWLWHLSFCITYKSKSLRNNKKDK